MLNKRKVNVGKKCVEFWTNWVVLIMISYNALCHVNKSVTSGGESLSEAVSEFSHQTAVSHWIVALVKDMGSGDPGERCGWPQRSLNVYLIRSSSRCPGSAGADSDVNSL